MLSYSSESDEEAQLKCGDVAILSSCVVPATSSYSKEEVELRPPLNYWWDKLFAAREDEVDEATYARS